MKGEHIILAGAALVLGYVAFTLIRPKLAQAAAPAPAAPRDAMFLAPSSNALNYYLARGWTTGEVKQAADWWG